jgi:putative ABC transport system ATP-binding protein
MSLVKTENLKKSYQMGDVEVSALRQVDLVVSEGEFVAIMGPSGSGKSTLLHLLGGLDGPSDGEITLAGRRLSRLSDDELTLIRRRQIGFVFQFYNLLPTLTAAENVALPLLIDGRSPDRGAARVDGLLEMVGLSDRRDHRPAQLSGGEQQRVAIARALANEPQIVLADEPTGNLDSNSGAQVLALLRRANRELGATIVMVTHDPRAAAFADRIIFLKDGQILRELVSEGDGLAIQAIVEMIAELEL